MEKFAPVDRPVEAHQWRPDNPHPRVYVTLTEASLSGDGPVEKYMAENYQDGVHTLNTGESYPPGQFGYCWLGGTEKWRLVRPGDWVVHRCWWDGGKWVTAEGVDSVVHGKMFQSMYGKFKDPTKPEPEGVLVIGGPGEAAAVTFTALQAGEVKLVSTDYEVQNVKAAEWTDQPVLLNLRLFVLRNRHDSDVLHSLTYRKPLAWLPAGGDLRYKVPNGTKVLDFDREFEFDALIHAKKTGKSVVSDEDVYHYLDANPGILEKARVTG